MNDHTEASAEALALEVAIEHVRALCEFAYAQGFHELGYDPVSFIARHLTATQPVAAVPEFQREDLPATPYMLDGIGLSRSQCPGYRSCDVIDIVNAWTRKHFAAQALRSGDGGEAVAETYELYVGKRDALGEAYRESAGIALRFTGSPLPPGTKLYTHTVPPAAERPTSFTADRILQENTGN